MEPPDIALHIAQIAGDARLTNHIPHLSTEMSHDTQDRHPASSVILKHAHRLRNAHLHPTASRARQVI
jgi:hypothetical protein